MTGPAYLDFKGALDALAPPEAVKVSPIPVVIMANLNRLADQVFVPRAMLGWQDNTFNGPQLVIRPTGGGGVLVDFVSWILGTGSAQANVIRGEAAAVIPTADTVRMETGGPLTTFVAGLRDFEAIGGIQVGREDSIDFPIFVAPGDLFVVGRNTTGMTAFGGTAVVREIPVTPMGG